MKEFDRRKNTSSNHNHLSLACSFMELRLQCKERLSL